MNKIPHSQCRLPLFTIAIATVIMVADCSTDVFAESPRIYSAPDSRGHSKYLGNYSTNKFDPRSVSNPHSKYGSQHSPSSVNNPHGRFGSIFSPSSRNNSNLWNGTLSDE